jgi:hypothetical protein
MRVKELLFLFCLSIFSGSLFGQDIAVTVKGISNEQFDGLQKDREEAIVEAKRQACEMAGLNLSSITKVENFKIKQDLIETKAKAVLLPGFRILDIGYLQTGQYVVVLSGAVKSVNKKNGMANIKIFIKHNNRLFLGSRQGALDLFYKERQKCSSQLFNGKLIEEFEKDLSAIYKKKDDYYTLVFVYNLPEGAYSYKHTGYKYNGQLVTQNMFLRAGGKYLVKNIETKNGINSTGFGPIREEEASKYKKEFGKFYKDYEKIYSN